MIKAENYFPFFLGSVLCQRVAQVDIIFTTFYYGSIFHASKKLLLNNISKNLLIKNFKQKLRFLIQNARKSFFIKINKTFIKNQKVSQTLIIAIAFINAMDFITSLCLLISQFINENRTSRSYFFKYKQGWTNFLHCA